MVAFSKPKATTKRLAGIQLENVKKADVLALWKRLHKTHNIGGTCRGDGPEMAWAIPKSPKKAGQKGWVGFTHDGETWHTAFAERGVAAGNLMVAMLREVVR